MTRRSSEPKIQLRNIQSIFTRRHYNSYEKSDGTKDDRIEKFFAYELDNFVPSWISSFEKSLSTGRIEFDKKATRQRFVQFFYNHMKRTPDFLEPVVAQTVEETFHPGLREELERELGPLSESEILNLNDPEFRDRITLNARVQNIGSQTEHILNLINSLDLLVATPSRPNKEFVCGSNPVIRFENFPKQPLGDVGVELWTTLTPKLAVGFLRAEQAPRAITLADDQVRKINVTLAKNSNSIAGRSEILLASLIRSSW